MVQSKVVLIEGIMGSGKSSTAQFVADTLENQNRAVELYLEGNLDHPADYDAVGCLDEHTYRELVGNNPEHAALLEQHSTRVGNDRLVSYGKISQQIPSQLLQEIAAQDVYDGIPLAKHRELLQGRWSQFAEEQAKRESTAILECCFMQNPMCAYLAKHNAGKDAVVEHILRLGEIIQPLNPLLVYYYQRDVRASVERVCEVRSKEWLDFVIGYHTEQGYGKAHGLRGFDGLIEFLQMRQELELELCAKLPFQTLVIDNTDHDWDRILPQVERELLANR